MTPPDAFVGAGELPIDRPRAVTGEVRDLAIGEPGDLEREQLSVAWSQRRYARERGARFLLALWLLHKGVAGKQVRGCGGGC